MPRKPLRQCAIRTCPNLVEKDGDVYCKVHKPLETKKYDTHLRKYKEGRRYDSRWNILRKNYIALHPICEWCKKEKATIVHHKIPVEENTNLKYVTENLMSVCASCHKKIHDALGRPTYKF